MVATWASSSGRLVNDRSYRASWPFTGLPVKPSTAVGAFTVVRSKSSRYGSSSTANCQARMTSCESLSAMALIAGSRSSPASGRVVVVELDVVVVDGSGLEPSSLPANRSCLVTVSSDGRSKPHSDTTSMHAPPAQFHGPLAPTTPVMRGTSPPNTG